MSTTKTPPKASVTLHLSRTIKPRDYEAVKAEITIHLEGEASELDTILATVSEKTRTGFEREVKYLNKKIKNNEL